MVLRISIGCALKGILKMGKASELKPKHNSYDLILIDEQWPYLGNKQKKVWLLYAICKESGGNTYCKLEQKEQKKHKSLAKKASGTRN